MSSSIKPLPRSLEGLSDINGAVVTPDDAPYEQFRTVFYGGIDKRPSAIVRVADVSDIQRVIRVARDRGLELAVRSGGHSVVGYSTTDGGLVIDLREMSKIEIDADARTAWVETGATALQVTKALASHGLAIGFGCGIGRRRRHRTRRRHRIPRSQVWNDDRFDSRRRGRDG